MMRGYGRNGYEEDLDQYEDDFVDDGDEEGDHYGEPKEEEPSNEVLEYRQRLKEEYRRKSLKENGASLANNSDKRKKLPCDNYGNFFGPSQSVIHDRVLNEHKSTIDNKLTARVSNPIRYDKKSPASTNGRVASVVRERPLKPVDQVKRKAQQLKDNRDYSSLFSEDSEFPTLKEPPRSVSVHKSDARSAQVSHTRKPSTSDPRRSVSDDRNDRRPVSANRPTQNRSVPNLSSSSSNRPIGQPSDSRKQHGSNASNRPGRPVDLRKQHGQDQRKMHSGSNAGNGHSRPLDPRKQHGCSASSGPGRPVDPRKQHRGNVGSMSGRPVDPKRLSSEMPISGSRPAGSVDKKTVVMGVKRHSADVRKTPLPKLDSSPRNQQADRNGDVRRAVGVKQMSKQPNAMSRPEVKPSKQLSRCAPVQVDRLKKRPARQFSDDEDDDAFSMLRKMTRNRCDPSKYSGDDDDSDMEANFDEIMEEEKRSLKEAKREDAIQARLIAEEERRERERKAKRLKRQ